MFASYSNPDVDGQKCYEFLSGGRRFPEWLYKAVFDQTGTDQETRSNSMFSVIKYFLRKIY
jgi:hypothetical protein